MSSTISASLATLHTLVDNLLAKHIINKPIAFLYLKVGKEPYKNCQLMYVKKALLAEKMKVMSCVTVVCVCISVCISCVHTPTQRGIVRWKGRADIRLLKI